MRSGALRYAGGGMVHRDPASNGFTHVWPSGVQTYDSGGPVFSAGRPGYAPEIPAMGTFGPNAPDERGMMEQLRDYLKQQVMMGGATDLRNMAQALGPSGLEMMLARGANPMRQLMQRGAGQGAQGYRDPIEQMFDVNKPAPVMGMPPRVRGYRGGGAINRCMCGGGSMKRY